MHLGDRETETAFNAAAHRAGIPPFDLGEKSPPDIGLSSLLGAIRCHEGALEETSEPIEPHARACACKGTMSAGKIMTRSLTSKESE